MESDYARFQREGWTRVADKYEGAWAGLTRLFIPDLLDAAHITAGQRVLDVACGPGYVADAVRRRGALPTGVDISPAMIRIARERNPGIEFHVADAVALDVAPHFHTVVSNFGVIHAPDYAGAFAEARRVLLPGGTFAFTVWAGPDASVGSRIMDEAIRAHADMTVGVPQGPDALALTRPDTCRALLEAAGFDGTSVVHRRVTHGWRVPTASFIFEQERDSGVRTAALLARQTPEVRAAIQRDLEAAMQAFTNPPGYLVPYSAQIVCARATS